ISHDITIEQYLVARADRQLHLHPGTRYSSIREPYFFGYVEDLLQQEYGTNTVREGGLRVYTTIRPGLQRAATAAVTHVLDRPTDPAAAIVSVDPSNGAIRAMAEVTPGRRGNQFNFVTSGARQPGSTFKTIALTTAVSEGLNPFTTTYLSAPFYYAPLKWNVQTYEHTYAGYELLSSATIQSDNTVYARLALDVGAQNIVDMARKLGIRTSVLTANPSIALGAESVTPLEEASAYATLAAGGIYSKPMAITKVVLADGKVHRRRLGQPAARARHSRLGREHGDAGADAEHAVRNGPRGARRGPVRRRQDGNDGQLRRRVVLRLHADTRGDGVDRLSQGRAADARRARDRRVGPDVPGRHLASLHGSRRREPRRRSIPGAGDEAGLAVVAGPVPVRSVIRSDTGDDDHRNRCEAEDALDDDDGGDDDGRVDADDHGRAA